MIKNNKEAPSLSVQAAKVTGRSALFLTKSAGKVGWAIAKPVGRQTGKLALKGGKAVKDHASVKYAEYELRHAEYTSENFYEKGAMALEDLVDALLIEKQGTSARIVRALSVKLAAAGTTAGLFSIASILGTASTGTVISSLSGAAFNSAALAWIGGSVATGGWIVLGAATAGGAVAYFGSRKIINKWTGKRRKKKSLDEQEMRFVETCLMLATAFRERAGQNSVLDPITAHTLQQHLTDDLLNQLDICIAKVTDWPDLPRRKLEDRKVDLIKLFGAISSFEREKTSTTSAATPLFTGVVSATVLKLMSSNLPSFTDDEELVLQALRRSNNSLANASNIDLSNYVQDLSMDQIAGLKNNVKGIYHELAFQQRENLDGDEYIVELFEDTNHAGADVRIINTVTGNCSEVQLKATNYESYVREHNQKYENIEVLTTSEIADASPDWGDSGFSNAEITDDTGLALQKLSQGTEAAVIDSMAVAAMVTLATNAKSMLKGDALSTAEKQKIIQDGVVAASVAGLVQLII
ncbi:hypothetical protein Q4555_07935 [Octadecabacter sp. 1_MG-2023]|uniref:hypothetical protein n=1 Tax=unclassified Octadecabacter TaxID=196158 RepID=UPI001C09A0A1|nr:MULTISPECIES: hypothetical protein [unclassified Octadecabacter]MBU2994116.1 hypothetical protein [Octadecabacter sp. B2R22]MDO6734595.1 hypothetical protein [Octadecabacter sp. 1_MG-2023]